MQVQQTFLENKIKKVRKVRKGDGEDFRIRKGDGEDFRIKNKKHYLQNMENSV